MQNLGMIALTSLHGAYLQGDSGGTVHASNEHRNEEETWYLFEVNRTAHQFALACWSNGKFLCKNGGDLIDCAKSDREAVGQWETWTMIKGDPYSAPGRVAFRAFDGTWLATNKPGDNFSHCGGEVFVSPQDPLPKDGNWAGWWYIGAAKTPTPGDNPWRAIGGVIEGVVNVIAPAAIEIILQSL